MSSTEKLLSQAIDERRATPSFDGAPIPDEPDVYVFAPEFENAA